MIVTAVFLKGIKEKSSEKCFSYIILCGLLAGVSLLQGLIYEKPKWIVFGVIRIFYLIVACVLFKRFRSSEGANNDSSEYEKFKEFEGSVQEKLYQFGENKQNGYKSLEMSDS